MSSKLNLLASLGMVVAATSSAQAALVAHYKLDETSGTGAADSAPAGGFQNAVQDSGTVSWTTGLIGGAVNIANTDLRIADPLLDGATEFTISAWVNLDTTAGGYKGIFMSRGAGNGSNWGFAHNAVGADFGIDYRFDNPGAGSDGKDIVSATLVGNWHHMVQVWRSDGTGETYLDGVAGPTTTTAATVFDNEPTANWFIGSDIDRRMDGQIDDIAVWDEAFTPAQVLQIYNGGLNGIDAPTSLIPEPSTGILAAFAGLALLARRRR